jgi:hypothetical protein
LARTVFWTATCFAFCLIAIWTALILDRNNVVKSELSGKAQIKKISKNITIKAYLREAMQKEI